MTLQTLSPNLINSQTSIDCLAIDHFFMTKTTFFRHWTLGVLFFASFLFFSCKDSSETPEPVQQEDERITLVKKWVSKYALQDLTKLDPKIEYFEKSRNSKEMISGKTEFSLNLARSLDTLTLAFNPYPVRPATGELPNLKAFYFLKSYPDLTNDRLDLIITPSTDAKTKGTVVVKQTFAGFLAGTDPLGGQADIWKITFTVPR